MRLAVFLERDGILNNGQEEAVGMRGTVGLEQFNVNHEAVDAVRRLKEAGFLVIATTNQPGISKGELSRGELDLMHRLLNQAFELDDVLVCPHTQDDECPCRKPQPGLFQEARHKWQLALDRSFVISNKWQDGAAAFACGSTSILIDSPQLREGHRDFVAPGLEAAVDKVLELHYSQKPSLTW